MPGKNCDAKEMFYGCRLRGETIRPNIGLFPKAGLSAADKGIVFDIKPPELVLILFGIVNSYSGCGNNLRGFRPGRNPQFAACQADAVMFFSGNAESLA